MNGRRTTLATRRQQALAPVLRSLLKEIKLLRRELRGTALPTERLEDYAHPARLRRSYKKAVRRYPPQA